MIMKCFVCYDIVNSKYKSNTFQKLKLNNCLQYSKGVLQPSDLRVLCFSFHPISASIFYPLGC